MLNRRRTAKSVAGNDVGLIADESDGAGGAGSGGDADEDGAQNTGVEVVNAPSVDPGS
jgi:hypothetical protein